MIKKEKYKYVEGELVKIKNEDKILLLVDELHQQDGYLFMPQMWQYCNKTYQIIKVVKNIFDEKKVKMYKVKVPTYLLKNLICKGEIEGKNRQCDHSCYFIWHENWLQKT